MVNVRVICVFILLRYVECTFFSYLLTRDWLQLYISVRVGTYVIFEKNTQRQNTSDRLRLNFIAEKTNTLRVKKILKFQPGKKYDFMPITNSSVLSFIF